jgi:acetyl esterase
MRSRHPIHPDYDRIPVLNLKFSSPLIWLINVILKLERYKKHARPIAGVERKIIAIANGEGKAIKAVVSRPVHATANLPILLYYHGGGFILTYSALHMQLCERYALGARCIVVMVDYRLGPVHAFPKGFDDCFVALQWCRSNADNLGGDANRIAVMGDSGGGTLAAGVAQKALDNQIALLAQLLVYPALDSECNTVSATDFTDVPLVNSQAIRRLWSIYLKDCDGIAPEYAAPGHRKSLHGLPRTLIDTAEFDPLRDEGIAYAKALEEQGVSVALNQTQGTIHGFEIAVQNPETVRSIEGRIAFLNTSFARSVS